MKYSHTIVFSMVVLILISSCASNKTVSEADPTADFSKIRTYNFVKVPDTTGRERGPMETGYLKTAVSREMKVRGISQSDNPDVVVNFSIETEEMYRSRSVPSGDPDGDDDPFYGAYNNVWGFNHEIYFDQYTEGRLNIDLIDPDARKILWHGSTQELLKKEYYGNNVEKTLNAAVTEIFTEFPISAPVSQ